MDYGIGGLCVDKNNALWVLHIDYDTNATQLSKILNGVTTKVILSGSAGVHSQKSCK